MTRRTAIALFTILVGACVLREGSVRLSVLRDPIRADAREYLLYAHNLTHFGVYSRAETLEPVAAVAPVPDAVRPPGYPLFLRLFLSDPPQPADVLRILHVQAALGTLTVLVVFLLARRLLPTGFALAAAALAAASPHLVGMTIYLLSETLLTLLLTLSLYAVGGLARGPTPARAALAGALLGAAALTHPQVLYFAPTLVLCMLLLGHARPRTRNTAAALALGFAALYAGWSLRNALSPGVSSDSTLMLRTLRTGVYRDFMYQDRPETYGYPYRYDPSFEGSSANLAGVLRAVASAWLQDPAAQLSWYVRKPWVAWTWDPVVGFGDVFIYAVSRTPYADRPFFRATHSAMRMLHAPLVVLMAVGVVLPWLPQRHGPLGDDERFIARVLALLVLYHAATMTLGFPLPRYSVPLRPCQYILAMLPLAAGWRRRVERSVNVAALET